MRGMAPVGPYMLNSWSLRMGSCSVVSCWYPLSGSPGLFQAAASLLASALMSLYMEVTMPCGTGMRYKGVGTCPWGGGGGGRARRQVVGGAAGKRSCRLAAGQELGASPNPQPHPSPAQPSPASKHNPYSLPRTCRRPLATKVSIRVRRRRMYIWRVRGTARMASIR